MINKAENFLDQRRLQHSKDFASLGWVNSCKGSGIPYNISLNSCKKCKEPLKSDDL
jgi:hypothetical protein